MSNKNKKKNDSVKRDEYSSYDKKKRGQKIVVWVLVILVCSGLVLSMTPAMQLGI